LTEIGLNLRQTAAIDAFSGELAREVRTPIVDPPASAKGCLPNCGLTFPLVPKQGKDPAKTQTLKTLSNISPLKGKTRQQNLPIRCFRRSCNNKTKGCLRRLLRVMQLAAGNNLIEQQPR